MVMHRVDTPLNTLKATEASSRFIIGKGIGGEPGYFAQKIAGDYFACQMFLDKTRKEKAPLSRRNR